MMILIIVLVAVLLVLVPISIYNRMIRQRNQIENAFGAIDAVLKKRFDMLQKLVETVRQYALHEKDTFIQIAALRSGKSSYDQMTRQEKMDFDANFGSTVVNIGRAWENYPDLKASDNFMHLQRTVAETEEQLCAARRAYNSSVTQYNNTIMVFPNSIFASMFNFRREQVMETRAEEREDPDFRQLFS